MDDLIRNRVRQLAREYWVANPDVPDIIAMVGPNHVVKLAPRKKFVADNAAMFGVDARLAALRQPASVLAQGEQALWLIELLPTGARFEVLRLGPGPD